MFGNKLIEILKVGFLTVNRLLCLNSTAQTLTANTANGYTTASVSQCAGNIAVQNTSGGTLGSITVTVYNTQVTSQSVILLQAESNSHSASGVEYLLQLANNGRIAGTSFQFIAHRATPSGSASFVSNEGLNVNYLIIN